MRAGQGAFAPSRARKAIWEKVFWIRKTLTFVSRLASFCGGVGGIRSRLRTRSGPALTLHRSARATGPSNPTRKKCLPDGRHWRSGWDSNPRALADNLISSQARYDHFDTAPRVVQVASHAATSDIIADGAAVCQGLSGKTRSRHTISRAALDDRENAGRNGVAAGKLSATGCEKTPVEVYCA